MNNGERFSPEAMDRFKRTTCDARRFFQGGTWLTKPDQAVKDNPAASGVHRVPAGAKAAPADENFSAARRCASSAPRKLKRSTTKTCALAQFVAESGKIVPRRL